MSRRRRHVPSTLAVCTSTRGVGLLVSAALLIWSPVARAALTSSERAQVRDFIASAKPEGAGRVRALVARTDLAPEESTAVLAEALTPVTFGDERAAFLHELLFGDASQPSRTALTPSVVKGALARADAIHQKYVGGLDHEPRALGELAAIYAFVDGAIANAGKPTSSAHDPAAALAPATYEECAKALRDHIDRNARWLKGDAALPESAVRVRTQAQVALVDMLPDGLTRRIDAADRLALKGARRQILTDWGILVADGGKLDDAKVEAVRKVLARLPGARTDVSIVSAFAERGLRARGAVVYAPPAATYPFGDEVTRGAFDPQVAGIVAELAILASRRALEDDAELRATAERSVAATKSDPARWLGRPHAPSVFHVVGAAVELVLLDADRAIDLAFNRYLGGKPEGAGLLSDALGVLAAGEGKSIPEKDAVVTAIKLGPSRSAAGFSLGGHAWTIERAVPSLVVTAVARDGRPLTQTFLPTARTKK